MWMKWATVILLSACLSPGCSIASGRLGPRAGRYCWIQARSLQEALNEFRTAIAENPNDGISHDYIGMILGEDGKIEKH